MKRLDGRLASPPLVLRRVLLFAILIVCQGASRKHAASLELHQLTDYPASKSYPEAVCNDGTPGAWQA
jgi:hypothetical protein